MDAERLQRIKLQAQEALNDMSPSGFLGWSAMTACVGAANLIEGLTEDNAAQSLTRLGGLATELEQIQSALQGGQHGDALNQALGRLSLVAKVAAEELQADS
jgi:hypothetical protein